MPRGADLGLCRRRCPPARWRIHGLGRSRLAWLAFVRDRGGGAAGAADGLRQLVEGGKRAGYQVVAEGDDGVTRTEFVFKDNGRGPELREEFSLNPDGTFRRYRVIGTSTFGAPVDEAFTLADGVARWTSTSDRGEQRVEAGAQYSPLGGSPAAASVSLAALAARPDGRLPLIPSGVLGARKVAEAQVRKGGDRRSVQLLAITGIGFAPSFAWATDEARPRLFAYIHPGFVQMIEEGWEANADALEEVQKRAESEALVAMHGRLAHRLPGTTLVRNARGRQRAREAGRSVGRAFATAGSSRWSRRAPTRTPPTT